MDEKRDESSFDQRLNDARERQRLNDPAEVAAAAVPAGDQATQSAWGLGARIGVELASALVVGVVIGLALDRWLHTTPIFLVIFFLVGAAAGMLNVWRLTSPRKPPVEKKN